MKLAEGIYANFINKAELKLKSEQATTKLEEIRVLKGY